MCAVSNWPPSSHRSLEQCDVPLCFKRSPMLQNPSSHRSSTDHWSSAMSLHASNARQCFKTRLHTDLQQITGAVRCPFMLQTLVNASKPVFTQIFNRSLEQCDVPSCFKRSSMLQNPSSHRSSTDHWSSAMSLHASSTRQCFKTRLHTDLQQITGAVRCPFMLQTLANASKPVFTQIFNRSLEQCDVPSCFKRSSMLQNPSSHRSSTDHWSSAMSLHASNARQCFKTRLHTDLQQITGAVRCPFMLQTLVNASKPVFTQIFNRSLEQCDVPSCFKHSSMLQNPSSHRSSTDHWSSAMSLHASNARQCFKTHLHTDLHTDHWSSAMSLHASNARQCFKTRLHTNLQQVTGAVRCPFMLQTLVNASKPVFTQIFNRSLEQFDVPYASNARQCFKTRLHTDLQQVTGAVRCPFMLQTLTNASKPVFTQIFNRSLEQCDVPSCFKRSSMLQNPSSHRSSTDHWSSAMSLHASNARQCFKTRLHTDLHTDHWSSSMSPYASNAHQCFKTRLHTDLHTDHWSSAMSLHASNARQCFKTRLHTDLHTDHWSSSMSLHASNTHQCFKTRLHTDLHTDHWSSSMSLHASNTHQCFKTRLHTDLHTDHWSSSMSLHASNTHQCFKTRLHTDLQQITGAVRCPFMLQNARQCFKTRLHTDLQQITGAVRCPFMLQTLVNASKPVFTQIFNRSLEQCDVPSCFKRSSMLQNPSSHRSSTDHWSSSMSLHASNARQCFKTRLHTDLQQITGAVRCPFMLQTLVNASKPVFTQIFNRSLEQCDVPSCLKHSPMLQNLSSHRSSHRSLEQCDVPSCLKHSPMLQNPSSHRSSHRSLEQFDVPLCFKRSSMLQNPSSHRSSTDHWSSAMSLHASNARQCFKTRLHTDLHTDHWSSAMSLHASNAHQCFKTRLHTDLQQITGAVRCPLVFEALHHHPRPKETQDNRT